jgi:hypothetical protein
MARFKKGDTVRIGAVGRVERLYSLGNVGVMLKDPTKWDREQEVVVWRGDLIRAKNTRSLVGCQNCVRDQLREMANRPARLMGGLYSMTLMSRDDCPSAHNDACEDDSGEKPKRKDPDEMDEPEEPDQ